MNFKFIFLVFQILFQKNIINYNDPNIYEKDIKINKKFLFNNLPLDSVKYFFNDLKQNTYINSKKSKIKYNTDSYDIFNYVPLYDNTKYNKIKNKFKVKKKIFFKIFN